MLRAVLLAVCAWISLLPAAQAQTPPGFAGEWETTYGRMSLKVDGAAVTGTYGLAGGEQNEIQGRVEGGKLEFTYTEPAVTGTGSFQLAANGRSFTGRWRPKGATSWQPWTGRRFTAAARSFSGLWKTSYGLMRLIQTGDRVEGCYAFVGQASIKGKLKDGALAFTYREPDGTAGHGEFRLANEGASFTGTWQPDGGTGGVWSGKRLDPVPGRVWLVVLEAHWETTLRENEYSYGEMLRQFFSRVPSVAVRHRYFDSRVDFARWCEELAYLNEPVILYLGSHGTEQGLTVGNETLSGEFIGAQLRHAAGLQLVHLGSCLVMAGPAPAQLRKASGLDIPVSGYTRVADWAGSAVIDFAYLDLVLSRRLPPAEAVAQLRRTVTFAGETDLPDSAIKPAGLTIVPAAGK